MQENVHKGHRQRMRRKLLEFSHRVFDTYELLEMLLYYTNARRDTNPISKNLLSGLGSLDDVLSAKDSSLTDASGIGTESARLISRMNDACDYYTRLVSEVFDNTAKDSLPKFVCSHLGEDEVARTAIISLDNAGRPIAADMLFSLDFSSGGIKPSAFVGAAIGRGASSVAIAHSHPFGHPFPTDNDMQSLKLITEALVAVGVSVRASFVVTGCEYYEMLSGSRGRANQDEPLTHSDANSEGRLVLSELFSVALSDGEAQLSSLLLQYGTVSRLLLADPATLTAICSQQAAVLIALIPALAARRLTDKYPLGKKYARAELEQLLVGQFLSVNREQVLLLSFDKRSVLISCDLVCEGTVSASEILPRMLLDTAKRRGAHSVILAHNHPRGRAVPSGEDIAATEKLKAVLEYAEIKLGSHYIVAEGKATAVSVAQ